MKQSKFLLLTLVVVAFTGVALTHTGKAHARREPAHSAQTHSSLASAAIQRWRLGGTTHWRSMLLQR